MYEGESDVVVRFVREISKEKKVKISNCKTIKSDWGRRTILEWIKRLNRDFIKDHGEEVIFLEWTKKRARLLVLRDGYTLVTNVDNIIVEKDKKNE